MSFKIAVSSIACEVCGQTITKAIQNQDAQAQVTVDVAAKTVAVETVLSEAEVKELIVQAGHNPN
ncbi:copper-binding metallochaperone [[Synechococcus] sp. NIES-970]|uniref:heavy-metal-associated domain-containing protein n=1 Tax=Picosynechococcus sp. NKBG15041c TaxID=1407650 RepID=UPI0003FD64FA|nr:heavy-metal-associated domain-containing protein [Picosynechococcus sp. NKBG15041c]BAW95455.1 copper-binding metallochaperone [[Synechococcus] sp. NIES-970]